MLLDGAGFESANAGRVKSNKVNRVNTISDDNFFFTLHTPENLFWFRIYAKAVPTSSQSAKGAKFKVQG